jgi:pimeloyl-ACP methyl ester carboxylesterase
MSEHVDFIGPAQLRTRGTVLVVPGRGESPASYNRLGRRLAADSYRVRVLAAVEPPQLERVLTAAVAGLADRPLVLAGTDIGAAALAALLGRSGPAAPWWPDAVVLAGLPGYGGSDTGSWDDELDVRTHCPVHREVLRDDPAARPGSLATAVPAELLDAAYSEAVDIPHLLLVGDADPLADRDELARFAKALPSARLTVVHGAHHDVLNDLQHRSVAAEIVTFLEALRGDPPLGLVVEVESSTW